jgi:hypothetical protein
MPFISTDAEPEERIAEIQLIHLVGNMRALSISIIAECSMVSNALEKSSLMMTISLLD